MSSPRPTSRSKLPILFRSKATSSSIEKGLFAGSSSKHRTGSGEWARFPPRTSSLPRRQRRYQGNRKTMTNETVGPLQPGDEAPAFVLPSANREGDVSLEEFRGKSPVLVGLYRGLHCPFCRRQLASLDIVRERLQELDVEVMAVVNTQPERARLYFRYRPTSVLLAADPERNTHGAFGVPLIEVTDDESDWPRKATMAELTALRMNPTGELSEPLPPFEANDALNKIDGFELTQVDEQILATYPTQLIGQFLIDRSGIIRWRFIEAENGMAYLAQFPSAEDFVAAATTLAEQ